MSRKLGLTRRQWLSATGTGLAAGIAGCTGGGGGQDTDTPATGGTATPSGGTATPSAGPKHIQPGDTGNEVHILTDYSNDAWQNMWEKTLAPVFEDDLGVKTKVEYMGFQGTGEQRLTTLLQAGTPPETFTCSPFQLGDMLGRGQLAWTTHIVDYLVEKSGELVGAPLEFNIDGETVRYRVPHGQYTDTWNYRTDILEQHGLKIPETHEELLHNAKTIDESDKTDARGATVSAVKSGQSASQFETVMQLKGVWYWQWKDKEAGESEVWFPKQEIVEGLKFYKKLAQYSPDPTSVDWGSTLSFWAGGRAAQMYHLNGWPAGVAANAGNMKIARNTGVSPIPLFEGVGDDPMGRGNPGFDGHPAIGIADNVAGWFKILQYMYEDPERAAPYYSEIEPTRFVPAYSDIMEADAYTNADIFKKVPNLLSLNIKCRDEVAPLEPTSEDLAQTPATAYAGRFPILSEMTNQVVVQGRDPEKAWEEANSRFEKRLQEGKKLVAENL